MRRWLLVGLGLAMGLAALYALATARAPASDHEEIDEASRARLERVLRESADDEPQLR